MATTALKFIACWDSSSKCVHVCVFVCENVHFCFWFECVRVPPCVSNCSPSARGKYSSHLSSSASNLETLHAALAFSPSFPLSQFFKPPSSHQRVKEQGPAGSTACKKKKEYLTFHHLGLSLLLPLCLSPFSSSLWSSTCTRSASNCCLIFNSCAFICSPAPHLDFVVEWMRRVHVFTCTSRPVCRQSTRKQGYWARKHSHNKLCGVCLAGGLFMGWIRRTICVLSQGK